MKRITWNRVTSLGFMTLLLLPALTGCSKEKVASEELEALNARFEKALDVDDLGIEEYENTIEDFKPEYEALAEKYWGTEGALEAKLWLMRSISMETDTEKKNAALEEMTDAIFARYSRSPYIDKLADFYSLFSEEQRDKYLGDLRENSPHANVRAAMIYAAAQSAIFELRYARGDIDPGLEEARTSNLQLLVDEYYDIPVRNSSYGAVAEAHLSAHDPADLAIGKPAPEIVGQTVDGEEIRLSDFRGKVVVIDFWGDW